MSEHLQAAYPGVASSPFLPWPHLNMKLLCVAFLARAHIMTLILFNSRSWETQVWILVSQKLRLTGMPNRTEALRQVYRMTVMSCIASVRPAPDSESAQQQPL